MINKEIYGSSFIELAAIEWYDVRTTIFSKEKTDIDDWSKLANAENNLMNAVKRIEKIMFEKIKQEIIDLLSPDMLEKKYRILVTDADPKETGHCAIASEAFYHLVGGKNAGFMPVVCPYYTNDAEEYYIGRNPPPNGIFRKETHWWVRGQRGGVRGAGKIYDMTVKQYDFPFPYRYGKNTGFMQQQGLPSIRAKQLIDKVIEKIGYDQIFKFQQENIEEFNSWNRHVEMYGDD